MTEAVPLGVDVDALMMEILRPPTVPEAVTVQEVMPAEYTSFYPLVRAYRPPGGGSAVDPRWLDIATVNLEVFDDDRTNAFLIARICRGALFTAWLEQRIYLNGSISSFEELTGPAELRLPIQPDGETRVQASFSLGVCPPLI